MPRRTTPAPLSILDVLTDRRFLRPWFGETWDAWRVFAKALFGLDMATHEREAYTRFTGRTTPPTAPAREAWVIVGRRGGKSLMAAALAVYAAAFRDYRPFFKPGDLAFVMVIACD